MNSFVYKTNRNKQLCLQNQQKQTALLTKPAETKQLCLQNQHKKEICLPKVKKTSPTVHIKFENLWEYGKKCERPKYEAIKKL